MFVLCRYRFYDKKVAEVAMREMDGYILYGRKLKVQMALISRPDPQRRYNYTKFRFVSII